MLPNATLPTECPLFWPLRFATYQTRDRDRGQLPGTGTETRVSYHTPGQRQRSVTRHRDRDTGQIPDTGTETEASYQTLGQRQRPVTRHWDRDTAQLPDTGTETEASYQTPGQRHRSVTGYRDRDTGQLPDTGAETEASYHCHDSVDVVLSQQAGGAPVLGCKLNTGRAPAGVEVNQPQLSGRPAAGPLLLP